MTLKFSEAVRDLKAIAYEEAIGPAPIFQIRTGAPPANCAAADTGTILAEINLPSDWLTAPDDGMVEKSGTWTGVGIAAGTAGHFRIRSTLSDILNECMMQGTLSEPGGGGDAIIVNEDVEVDQPLAVVVFRLTEAGG